MQSSTNLALAPDSVHLEATATPRAGVSSSGITPVHLEATAMPKDGIPSSEIKPAQFEDTATPYIGIPSSEIKPVFKAACKIREQNPSVADIILITNTKLSPRVVKAIIDGAIRLLPPDNSSEGKQLRRALTKEKELQARKAENEFVAQVRRFSPAMLDEYEQRQRIKDAKEASRPLDTKMTPDILFSTPTEVDGIVCHWMEYKFSFGFKLSPFVYGKTKQQCQSYASTFGPGIIVYRIGFEVDLFSIQGVHVIREREISSWLDQQNRL